VNAEGNNHPSRADFIRAVVAGGLGLGVASTCLDDPVLGTASAGGYEDFQSILTIALIAEQLASTFYYTVLTSREMMSDSQLGGSSTDPTHPGLPPNGNPNNVRFLQAALDAEVTHAAMLLASGAIPKYTHFYFPAGTFTSRCLPGELCTLGSSSDPNTFLGVLDVLETAFVGAYLTAIPAFVRLGHPTAADVAANIAAVESEHLVVGRTISGAMPSNNLSLQPLPFAAASDAAAALRPFLTGMGFPNGATSALPLPTPAQIRAVVGRESTRVVARFL
jgi:hypothetical protein